ncbi:MAG: hypothetical protein JXQ72_07075 [Anaerolineae bacterium]|nr:hypothetical protein [Anaerolineae bacterium]
MEANERQRLLSALDKLMNQRSQDRALLSELLKEFSERLFTALERVLSEIATSGVKGIGKARRLVHPAGGGREGFQMFIEDWSIIFVPLLGFARPNTDDEARIPPVQFKELCGRIAVFLTDDPEGDAFYDFLVFNDRSWFAWGYGWPKQQADIDDTDFEALALELIHSFVKDIFVTWHPRESTFLKTALDTKQRPYTFGLPGEERQGG